ncbi:MAG TPA: DUF2333 family protein [Pseudomonadales bacterium]
MLRISIIAVSLLLLALAGLGIYWSQPPAPADIRAVTAGHGNKANVTGVATTATLIYINQQLLDKRGGYISNDVMPPGILLDNIRNWEYGALLQVRDMTRAMRDTISRSQSQSKEDTDLALAESRFNISHRAWAFPSAEAEYRDGIRHLDNYLARLTDDDASDAQFYARADNLRSWLSVVEVRLGGLSQRLSASVGQRRLNTDLAGDASARQSTPTRDDVLVKTPWLEIDDVFYQARGTSWALTQLLQAAQIDFADVLKNKNAEVSMAQIIRELQAAQQPLASPMVLNGKGFGLWANHSLVMASYLSRANAAIIDLRALLEKG